MQQPLCTIRPYMATDEQAVLALLAANTPAFFAPEEADDLRYFLHQALEYYFVAEMAGNVVGAGGFNLPEGGACARLSWDMVHPAHHGKSIGSNLLTYRLREITNLGPVTGIEVRTSQLAYRFYEKSGFLVMKILPDFWAKGFDLYHMVYAPSGDERPSTVS